MTRIYRHRPRGTVRHYAGLLGPTGAVAGRVVAERDLPLRVARLKNAVRSRRARIEPMRALVASPGGRLCWRRARAPGPPVPLGANVRPLAMATCDLDRPLMLGATPFPLPLQLGHECVAEVIAVGGEVRTVAPGQRVVVPFQISCGTCPPCLAGRTGNCAAVPPASMYGFGIAGGLSRSVRVPLLRSFGRNVTIHIGRSNARTVIPEVLATMADGRLQPHRVTTLTAPLDDAVGALREHSRDDAIKTILTA